ncbi:MAG: adenylate/guanylate cyclase domain-containing protein [Ilumatobacteraceae bacterium]
MALLDSAARAALPNSAFAHVDARGRRRLPIHDEPHVRNALARFSQVTFDDEADRQRALKRLLNAAKRHGIVPVGFITSQLRTNGEAELPTGFVTMLMTDIEGSTSLVHRLGDRYGALLDGVRQVMSDAVVQAGGFVVEARADEFFAVFEPPHAAIEAAIAIQRTLRARSWDDGVDVRVRIGIHSGYPTKAKPNYVGLAVHTAARICAAGHGGQIVVSGDTKTATTGSRPSGVRFRSLGDHRLRGLPEAVPLFQIGCAGLPTRFPPLRASAVSP